MKTTLDLPDELVHAVKLRAVTQRRTVKDLVADYLRQGLGMAPPALVATQAKSSRVMIDTQGLPVVQCRAGASATRMAARALMQLEQAAQADEDLQRAGIAVRHQRLAGCGLPDPRCTRLQRGGVD